MSSNNRSRKRKAHIEIFPRGKVVWAKMKGHSWWPGVVIDAKDVGYCMEKGNSYRLICWLGETSISEISVELLKDFMENYDLQKDKKNKQYNLAVREALQELSSRHHKSISSLPDEQLEWAKNSFWPRSAKKSVHMSRVLLCKISCVKQKLIENEERKRNTATTSGHSSKVSNEGLAMGSHNQSLIAGKKSCTLCIRKYFPENQIVWAKIKKFWWPSAIINLADRRSSDEEDSTRSIYSFGDRKTTRLSVTLLREFIEWFDLRNQCREGMKKKKRKQYRLAMFEALEELSRRIYGSATHSYENKLQIVNYSFLPRRYLQCFYDLIRKVKRNKSPGSMSKVSEEKTYDPQLQYKCGCDFTVALGKKNERQFPYERIDAEGQIVTVDDTKPSIARDNDRPPDQAILAPQMEQDGIINHEKVECDKEKLRREKHEQDYYLSCLMSNLEVVEKLQEVIDVDKE